MSDLVPSSEIEGKVGVKRHPYVHYARAVSAEQTVYVLHSQSCLDSGIDLRACRYSLALDHGIDERVWAGREDVPVVVAVPHQRLEPLTDEAAAKLLAVSERIDPNS